MTNTSLNLREDNCNPNNLGVTPGGGASDFLNRTASVEDKVVGQKMTGDEKVINVPMDEPIEDWDGTGLYGIHVFLLL